MTDNEPVSAHATASPALPRWLLPKVRVRRRREVICVEQVVPARVAEIHVNHSRGGIDGSPGMDSRRRQKMYESGLGPLSSIPLVRERLTIPTGIVSTDQVTRAIQSALGSFTPTRRRAAAAASLTLGRTLLVLVVCGFMLFVVGHMFQGVMEIERTGTPFDAMTWVFPAVLALFVLAILFMGSTLVRQAWILRTPRSVAEEQWVLLRQVLTTLSGQEPGSSRPLDVELGRRRDLMTHPPSRFPQGARNLRGTTADGRLGPPWPDPQDLHRLVRAGRRRALATGAFLTVLLGLAGLITAGIVLGLGLPMLPFACAGLSIAGGIMLQTLKTADPVVLAYPRHLPGDQAPREVRLEEVDVPSLPGWCAARRREDIWNAAFGMCVILFAGSVAGLLVGGMMSGPLLAQDSSDGASSGPAGLLLTAAVALVVVVSAVLSLRRVARRDAERRRQADMLQARHGGILG